MVASQVFLDRGQLPQQVLVPVVPPRSLQLGLLRRGFLGGLCIQLANNCRRRGFRFAGGALQARQAFGLDALRLTRGIEQPAGLFQAGRTGGAGAQLVKRGLSLLQASRGGICARG